MIHDEIKTMGDIVCPFCDQKLEYSDEKPQDCSAKYDLCCDCQEIINNSGMVVCRSCGSVHRYETSVEYVDFYENKHKMKRKSVYHRKYHISNILTDLSVQNKIVISVEQKNKILRIFAEINKIIPNINEIRKRIISLNFILRKIFKLLSIKFDNLPITKSKKTLASYEKYWNHINRLIGDKIKKILMSEFISIFFKILIDSRA